MALTILVGSYTNDVYTLKFDPDASSLTLASSVEVGFHPSWITPHPKDASIVFAGLEQPDGKIVSVKFDGEGRGTLLGGVPSGGADPCSLLAVGDEVLVGNVCPFAGTFASIPISSDPPHLQGSGISVTVFQGTGPNKERQEGPHIHQVYLHPEREELLLPDLGADLVHRFAKSPEGIWKETGAIKYKAGGGPRHVVVYNGVLYTVLELTSEVTAHKLPSLPAEPELLATVPTMSNPPPTTVLHMLAAEILLPTPNASFPTPYLYVSNRNDPSPEGDIIAIYSVADPDKLELVTEVRSGLDHLRGMVFGGPDDKYLIAGGVHGGGVKIFERADGGESLRELSSLSLEAPTGFLWL